MPSKTKTAFRGTLDAVSKSQDLSPQLRQGLSAITVVSCISFFAATTLFLYLSYKLLWHFCIRKPSEGPGESQPRKFETTVDFALGIDVVFKEGRAAGQQDDEIKEALPQSKKRQPPNQFLILIFNLLLADMHQALAFFLNAEWLRQDEINVSTSTCFAQGLFLSTGDLASSCFIATIAVHTYLSVIKRKLPSQKALYISIASVWLFVYGISVLPILATNNGAKYGGFFVRATSWCWINHQYPTVRLLTHYLFIFISIALTSALYLTIFISLRRQSRKVDRSSVSSAAALEQKQLSHNPVFLIYPIIYVICTLPLALCRLASMAGLDVPVGYLCFAGAMIASNGSFDCLIFGTTRNLIIFASKHEVDMEDTGLNTFTFMQTPKDRKFGNMVWIQGGTGRRQAMTNDKTTGGWWSWKRIGSGFGEAGDGPGGQHRRGSRSISQESLRHGAAIQMETVTSVVVEIDLDKDPDPRFAHPTGSSSPSVNSVDKYSQRLQ